MKTLVPVILVFYFMGSCTQSKIYDPCSRVVNGVYQYPTTKPPSNLTAAEKREYGNIPEEVLSCLNTGGLLTSCLNHPNLALFMLGAGTDGLQSGYDLMKK
jgi:hypothetical protein